MKRKMLALALSLVMLLGIGATTVYALEKNKTEETPKAAEETTPVAAATDTEGLDKDETVYVMAGADGSVNKIIVSDWISNELNKASVTDTSDLTDVETVKGDTGCTMGGNNSRVWDAQGNDIYYQGNIEKELPVTMTVHYTLDGKSITPEELAGKSGKLTIRYDYTNNQYETVNINGTPTRINVPFAMLTGVLLDNDVCSNVRVTNGKCMNDGDRMAVVGVAFPGLQENLGVDALSLPSYVEISADVQNFSLTTSVTIAANEVFNEVEESKLNSVDDLSAAMTKMTDAMSKLMDGSSQLYDGLNTLLEKSGTLIDGIDKLAMYAGKLKDGSAEVANGAKKAEAGATKLSNGLTTLTGYNDALGAGAEKVFNTLLATTKAQFTANHIPMADLTIQNYKETLQALLTSPTDEQKGILTGMVNGQLKAGNIPDELLLAAKYLLLHGTPMSGLTSEALQAVAPGAAQNADAINAAAWQLAVPTLKPQVDNAITQLDSYNTFYNSLLTYTSKVSDAADGAADLADGVSDLKDGTVDVSNGASGLYDGILQLKNGTPELTEGITDLRDGSLELKNGLTQFKEEAIDKIMNAAGVSWEELAQRLRATVQVSKDYKSFSGISDAMDGQVRFIYRTDSIGDTTK
jgi:putative membrane protein